MSEEEKDHDGSSGDETPPIEDSDSAGGLDAEAEGQSEYPPGAETPPAKSDADAALEERLAQPVLQGIRGIERAQVAFSAFLILLFGAVYLNTLGIPFVYGDYPTIVDNLSAHRIATVSEGWSEDGLSPLAAISVALNWQIGSGSPFQFRLFSIFIHLCNGVLVYLLARRVLRREEPESLSMAAGMLFVVHPAMTQAVNYLAHGSVLLMTFFVLLSLVLYLRATQDRENLKTGTLAMSLVALALAWAADPSAWIVVLLVPAIDYAGNKDSVRSNLRWHSAYLVLVIALAVAHAAAYGRGLDVSGILTQAGNTAAYIPPSVYPVQLSIEHAPFVSSQLPLLWGAGIVASLAALRFVPPLGVALFWYLAALAAPGLFRADGALMEERLYLPVAGLVLVAPWVLSSLPKSTIRTAIGFGIGAIIIGAALLTFMRNQVWQNETGLMAEAREACAECFGPAERLGELYLQQGLQSLETWERYTTLGNESEAELQMDAALNWFGRAEAELEFATSDPQADSDSWLLLGQAQRNLAKFVAAQDSLYRAIRLDPNHQEVTLTMATLLETRAAESDDPAALRLALDYYRRAAALGPLDIGMRFRYASLLANVGDFWNSEQVLSQLTEEEVRRPGIAQLRTGITSGLVALQSLQNEISQRARVSPDDPLIAKRRAQQLYLQGGFLMSGYFAESLVRSGDDDFELWITLGLVRAKMGAIDRFLQEHPEPPPTTSTDAPWSDLARECARAFEWEAALAVLRLHPPDSDDQTSPAFALGTIAEELNDAERAMEYYGIAARENPDDPKPWLSMFNIAFDSDQLDAAERILADAERRGADSGEIDERKEKLGIGAEDDLLSRPALVQ